MNNQTIYLKELGKEQMKYKITRREEIIKITAEIETKRQ